MGAFFGDGDYQSNDFCNGANGAIGMRGSATTGCGANGYYNPNVALHRVGPLIAYNFREAYHARFNAPTVFIALQWWVQHRYRTGATPEALSREAALGNGAVQQDFVASGVPYFALGFSFRGDLLYPRR